MRDILVITHTDYRQFQTGGIVTHCREFLRHAPDPTRLAAVGVTLRADEQVGSWQPYGLRPEVEFLPVMRADLERYNRRRLPFKLVALARLLPRLPGLLREHRHVYTNDLEFTAPALLLRGRARVVMASHIGPGRALRLNTSRWFRHGLVRRLYQACERWCVPRADAVVLLSREAFDDFRARFPAAAAKLHLVANGVDLEVFQPADKVAARDALKLPETAPVVAYVGRLEAQKNLGRGLAAFAKVREGHPSAMYLIAGDGSQRARLEEEARRLGLADGVRFLGDVAFGDLPRLYAAADVFLLSSDYEAMPMAVLEALACDRPVVSTPVGECVDLLREPGAGFTADDMEPGSLAGLVEKLLFEPPQPGCCRARAGLFSADAMAARLQDIITGEAD